MPSFKFEGGLLRHKNHSEPRIPLSTKADGEPLQPKVRIPLNPLGKKD